MLITIQANPSWQLSLAQLSPSLFTWFLCISKSISSPQPPYTTYCTDSTYFQYVYHYLQSDPKFGTLLWFKSGYMDQNIRLPDFFVSPRVSLHPHLHILHIAVCQHTFSMYTPTSSQAQNFDFDMVDVRLYWSECPFTLFLCFYKGISYPILHGSPAAKFRCRCKQSVNFLRHNTYYIIITIITLL